MRETRADYQNIKLKILQNNENIKFKNQELKPKYRLTMQKWAISYL